MTEANAYSLMQEGAQKLSTHFRVREFACKDGSDPLFISPQLVQLLEQVRTHFNAPVVVNSGYRTPAYNHSIPNASPPASVWTGGGHPGLRPCTGAGGRLCRDPAAPQRWHRPLPKLRPFGRIHRKTPLEGVSLGWRASFPPSLRVPSPWLAC